MSSSVAIILLEEFGKPGTQNQQQPRVNEVGKDNTTKYVPRLYHTSTVAKYLR